jgi:hypothetical protein
MSFVAVAASFVGEGLAANILGGAMLGGSVKVGTNVLTGQDPFHDIGRGVLMGGLTGGITPGVASTFDVSMPMAAGITSGGLTALATGDLGKGLAAGMGAYGLYGLSENMAAAGGNALVADANLLNAQQSAELSGLESMSNSFGGEGATAGADTVSQTTARATPFEKLSRGFDAAKASPGTFLKDNFKYISAAAAPILADQAVTSKLPTTTTKPGMIRPYSYDPYGGSYTAGTPYEAQVKKAADGGIIDFNESSNSPMSRQSLSNMQNAGGMFNYAHDGGGVMKMAEGGIAHFVLGGDVKGQLEQAYAANDVNKINEIARANMVTAADVADTYKGFDTSGIKGLQLYTPPNMENSINSMIADQKAGGDGTGNRTPTYTQYTPEQMGSFLSNPVNKDIDLQKAIKDTNADPNAVNRYIASLTSPFVGSTDTTGGSGTLGIYNNMVAQSIDPTEYYKAALASNPSYGGWNQQMIQKGYNLDKGALDLAKSLEGTTADPKLGYDKQWVKFMDDNKYTVDDMAQAFGLSRNEVQRRYNDAKAIEKKVDKVVTTGTGGAGATIPTTYNTAGTNVPSSLESTLGLPPGVSGAGATTVNPNGTITTRPDFSLEMRDVRDRYTDGGGSLGYIPYAPKTIDEFNAKYKNTGGSKAAYDYLMGKTPYSPVPYTATGEIMKPYFESVGKAPVNLATKKYVFVNGKYELNPSYVKPPYVLAGEKAAALSNKDTKPTTDPGTGNEWVWNSIDSKWTATPIGGNTTSTNDTNAGGGDGGGNAEGGLAALTMARGGTTHMPFFSKSTGKFTSRAPQVYADGGAAQFDLGGYSDGGRLLRGPGDGVSDSIPATIGNKRPARLADGEFVVPARIVSELGNGSTEAGARKLYAMMDRVQAARKGSIGKGKVANNSRSDKYLPA